MKKVPSPPEGWQSVDEFQPPKKNWIDRNSVLIEKCLKVIILLAALTLLMKRCG